MERDLSINSDSKFTPNEELQFKTKRKNVTLQDRDLKSSSNEDSSLSSSLKRDKLSELSSINDKKNSDRV
jgi:hypothetical protein